MRISSLVFIFKSQPQGMHGAQFGCGISQLQGNKGRSLPVPIRHIRGEMLQNGQDQAMHGYLDEGRVQGMRVLRVLNLRLATLLMKLPKGRRFSGLLAINQEVIS